MEAQGDGLAGEQVETRLALPFHALPQVIACWNLSGQYDYQLEVVAADHDAFARLVREKIRSLPGVKDISTSFTLEEVKGGDTLPVQT